MLKTQKDGIAKASFVKRSSKIHCVNTFWMTFFIEEVTNICLIVHILETCYFPIEIPKNVA